jgi:hypothetical protein
VYYRRGMDWWTDLLYTPLIITSNYSAIANLHNLQITRTHATSSQSAFISRFQVTDFNNEIFQLLCSRRCPLLILHNLPHSSLLYNLGSDRIENSNSSCIVACGFVSIGICLRRRYSVMAVCIFLSRCRCAATALHGTKWIWNHPFYVIFMTAGMSPLRAQIKFI